MRREVEVAQSEPLRLGTVGRQLGLDTMRLPGSAPPLGLADAAAERVEKGVDVRAHAQPEEGDVIAGVGDDGEVVGGGVGSGNGLQVVEQAAQESSAADATGQGGDAHVSILSAAGARRPRGVHSRLRLDESSRHACNFIIVVQRWERMSAVSRVGRRAVAHAVVEGRLGRGGNRCVS